MSNEFKGVRYSSMAMPWIPVGHPEYCWRSPADTDVTRTWKKYGWTPVELQKSDTEQGIDFAASASSEKVRQLRKGVGATRRRST